MLVQRLVSLRCLRISHSPDNDADASRPVGQREGKIAGLEILVQGSHRDTVVDLLIAEGVPKICIETIGGGKSKKK